MQANTANSPSRRRWVRWLIATALFAGLVIAWGSNRKPVDLTRMRHWHLSATSVRNTPGEYRLLRVASYNIHGGKGRDRRVDLQRIADDLKAVDFAWLQEVHAHPWRKPAEQAAQLSDLVGMDSAFLPTENRWWYDHLGNALLSRRMLSSIHPKPLVNTRGKAFRQAVLVGVPLEGVAVRVVMTHLDSQQDREAQLQEVIQIFHSLKAPAILMGDLNSGPDDPQIMELLSQPDVASVLDANAGQHVDWIITRGLECVDAKLIDSGASDHPVVKATLRLP